MAATPKMSLADLQKGLAKTPERADYNTIAGRALAGIDPRYLGGFDPIQYQSVFNGLYDNLSNSFAAEDLSLQQMYNDYERQYGNLGDDEAQSARKLMNAMANRGTLSSGAYLDESENLAGDFNRLRGDLGSNLQKGFTDAAGRRLQAIGAYNQGLTQQELGLGQNARGYAQHAIDAEAQAAKDKVFQEQMAAQNAAALAQQQAAIDARLEAMGQQYSYQEPAPEYYAPPPWVGNPQYLQGGFQASEPPYIPPPSYGQPGYQPLLKSNPQMAPVPSGPNSFTGAGGTRVNTGGSGTVISPGYNPLATMGPRGQRPRGVNVAV